MSQHKIQIIEHDDVPDVFADARKEYLSQIKYEHNGPKIGYIFKAFKEINDEELDLVMDYY